MSGGVSTGVGCLVSLALASLGFTLLSLTMARHANQVLGRAPSGARRRVMAAAGWCLLATSLVCCRLALEWGDAVVTWCGLLTLAALPLSLGLAHAPRRAILVGPAMGLFAAGFLLLAG